MSRATELRNDDTDRSCTQASSYHLGITDEGHMVLALAHDDGAELGMFLDADGARAFLDRFTAEMQEMGWLS